MQLYRCIVWPFDLCMRMQTNFELLLGKACFSELSTARKQLRGFPGSVSGAEFHRNASMVIYCEIVVYRGSFVPICSAGIRRFAFHEAAISQAFAKFNQRSRNSTLLIYICASLRAVVSTRRVSRNQFSILYNPETINLASDKYVARYLLETR